jgi:hypothetical protein
MSGNRRDVNWQEALFVTLLYEMGRTTPDGSVAERDITVKSGPPELRTSFGEAIEYLDRQEMIGVPATRDNKPRYGYYKLFISEIQVRQCAEAGVKQLNGIIKRDDETHEKGRGLSPKDRPRWKHALQILSEFLAGDESQTTVQETKPTKRTAS